MKERSGMPYDVVAYESDDLAMQLNEVEEGLFHRMLRRSWMNYSIPADLKQLANICRTNLNRLKKAWLKIEPLWKPHPNLPGRLINLKQESERAWVAAKSDASRQAAVKRWNQQKTQETGDANALPPQSDRNASPPHPHPLPIPSSLHSSNTEKLSVLNTSIPARAVKTKCPDEMPVTSEHWNWATGEGIGADLEAETRKMIDWAHGKGEKRLDWEATRRNWWRNAKNGGSNGHGQRESAEQGKERRNLENAKRVLARPDSETRSIF